ncbi:hypothetical protein DPMN_173206 [Dreissena polymorpha]|uniref:Uncharacterized protein n=1 Tax=Dreissena polymorpha TaxID=45954 RepID=A0A9D4IGR0_DREPO|nr:hypothetical protein DPMN_173206 [Dreissena polymorpha]
MPYAGRVAPDLHTQSGQEQHFLLQSHVKDALCRKGAPDLHAQSGQEQHFLPQSHVKDALCLMQEGWHLTSVHTLVRSNTFCYKIMLRFVVWLGHAVHTALAWDQISIYQLSFLA